MTGVILFGGLYIYMLSSVKCHSMVWEGMETLIEGFAVLGAMSCLLVLGHSSLDRMLAIGRGVFGCIVFFFLAIVTFSNLVLGFMAVNCVCKCYASSNAFKEGQIEDLLIFGLSISGSFCLIIILMIASVAL